MNVTEYLERRALSVLGLMPAVPPTQEQKYVFVNDFDEIMRQRINEYDTWYSGDSDEILTMYNYDARIEYRTEPYYYKNKRNYFWSVAAIEKGIKRTHSGFARNMIDTMVAICGTPYADVPDGAVLAQGSDGSQILAKDALSRIIDVNSFWSLYRRAQMPMTLVEGWGAYKVFWDTDVYGEEPVITYYRAQNVRVYRRSGRTVGMTFLDWYVSGENQRYLVAETRVWSHKDGGTFFVECFREDGSGNLELVSEEDAAVLPVDRKTYRNMPCLFAEVSAFYDDHMHSQAGRSVLEGKIDLLDDLDQALSQASNAIRRSTPVQVFDLDYAQRDKHGVPKMPNFYDCRFVAVQGKRNSMGEASGVSKPIDVVQPNLDIGMYNDHIEMVQRMIIDGVLSPCTLGLDVAKKDNADAQREKEKVTVFTKNHLCKEESRMLSSVLNQALIAKEYLCTGRVTVSDWRVSVEFDDFADASYENKIQTLSAVLANGGISPEEYVRKVYGHSLSEEEFDGEVKWVTERNQRGQAPEEGVGDPFGEGGEDGIGAALNPDAFEEV